MSAEFFDFIFGATEGGVVRLALSNPKKNFFGEQFYDWPKNKQQIVDVVKARGKGDIYFSPALFTTNNSRRSNVLGSAVCWVDLDTPDGQESARTGPWGALVASGSPGHAHAYVSVGNTTAPRTLELLNKKLTRDFNGDRSGWDANQLLRVPGTLNHKYDPPKPVKLLQLDRAKLWVPPPLEPEPEVKLEIEPVDAAEVLLTHNLSPTIRELLGRHPVECFDRSAALFYLGRLSSEAGLNSGEIYGLLAYADSKWGKFSGRDDKELRLTELVRRVEEGVLQLDSPLTDGGKSQLVEDDKPRPIGWFDLSRSERKIEWVIDGVVRQGGLTLLAGDTGVGKSTLALSLAAKVAVGAGSFLGNPITDKPQRVLYSSLEMDEFELTEFISRMSNELQGLEDRLNERAQLLPIGHSIPLDLESGQKFYEALLDDGNFTGLVIDTLGASVSASLSEEKPMRAICDWIDRVRKKYGIWVVVLHHPRKEASTSRKKQERTMDDIYGARIIGDRANVVLLLEKTGKRNMKLSNKKSRFREGGEVVALYRTNSGWIERGAVSDEGVEIDSPLHQLQQTPSNSPLDLA